MSPVFKCSGQISIYITLQIRKFSDIPTWLLHHLLPCPFFSGLTCSDMLSKFLITFHTKSNVTEIKSFLRRCYNQRSKQYQKKCVALNKSHSRQAWVISLTGILSAMLSSYTRIESNPNIHHALIKNWIYPFGFWSNREVVKNMERIYDICKICLDLGQKSD